MGYIKVYVAVTVYIDERGKIRPLSLFYNGKEYAIEKVIDVRTTPPEHVGGIITKRYDCVILHRPKLLFCDIDGRWFVEALEQNEIE